MVKNELDSVFASLRKRRRKALITYLAAGFPSMLEQKRLLQTIIGQGADIIELGIPFSDPIADGPTIQFATQQSLQRGTSLKKILKWVKEFKKGINAPIVLMGYLNPILRYGLNRFATDAARAGISGLIVPDMIPEVSGELRRALFAKNIHMIHLVSPTTPPERQKMIGKLSSGFLYAVSVTGVTGARTVFPAQTLNWLSGLRRSRSLPVCVGFGISGPKQIKHLKKSVDGFIVGSALIDILRKNKASKRASIMARFVRSLSKECE